MKEAKSWKTLCDSWVTVERRMEKMVRSERARAEASFEAWSGAEPEMFVDAFEMSASWRCQSDC